MQNKIFQTIVKISLVSLILAMSFQIFPVNAAGALTGMSDTMTRLKQGEYADHTVAWTNPAGVTVAAGNKARISFPAGFTTEAANWIVPDFLLYDGGGGMVADAVGIDANPASCVGDTFSVRINSATDEFEIWFCAGYAAFGAGDTFSFIIYGTDAGGHLTNPGAPANDLRVDLIGDDGGTGFGGLDDSTGSLALSIISDDQVIITANVDPTFTFALSSNTCALGALTTANVKTCTYTSTVATNATSGYVATIRAESDGTNINLNNDANAGIWINNVADFNITAGSEEYGFAIKSIGFGLPPSFDSDDGGCNNDAGEPGQALTASPVKYAGTAGPTAGHVETICHIAGISATSEAGTYTQVVTLIATGKF